MSKISVIVPVYKVEKYLARCVDSILAQTFKDYELILVDDGSPDNCPKICDEYAAKYDFIKVIHKENGGLSDARNFGIDYAMTTESEWITFIDSDDWVHPQYLEILYNACIENGVDISSCGFERVKEFSEEQIVLEKRIPQVIIDKTEQLFGCYEYNLFNIINAWGRLYKKSLFTGIRFPYGRYFEDSYTTYKVYFLNNIKKAVIKDKLYFYFYNNDGIILSEMNEKKLDDTFNSYLEKLEFFHSNGYSKFFTYFFTDYCRKFEIYYKKYNKEKKYRSVLSYYKKNIKDSLKKYKESLPPLLVKYGYKKWVKGTADKISVFWCDYRNLKKEKGKIFAILWALKNRMNYK